MKALYSIFFLVLFVLAGDAQSDVAALYPVNYINALSADSIIIEDDSIAISNKDSIKPVLSDSLILKNNARFGVASFYSRSLEGTKTATGEIFRHANLTAASNNYKLNTWVKVTNIKNGKSVIVRINDRMHPNMAKKGRVVDLTSTAALKIGITPKIGLGKVKVEEIEKPGSPDKKSVASR